MALYAAKTVVLLAIVEYACKLFPTVHRIIMTIAASVAVFGLDLALLRVNYLGGYYEMFGLIAGNVAVFGIPGLLFFLSKVKKNARPMA